jgi:hypothetical protein
MISFLWNCIVGSLFYFNWELAFFIVVLPVQLYDMLAALVHFTLPITQSQSDYHGDILVIIDGTRKLETFTSMVNQNVIGNVSIVIILRDSEEPFLCNNPQLDRGILHANINDQSVTFVYPAVATNWCLPEDERPVLYLFNPISRDSTMHMLSCLNANPDIDVIMGLLSHSPWKTTQPITDVTWGHISSYKTRYELEMRGPLGWNGQEAILSRRSIRCHPNDLILDGKNVIRDYNSFSYTRMSPLGDTSRSILWRILFGKSVDIATRLNALFAIWRYHISPQLYIATAIVFFIEDVNMYIRLTYFVFWVAPNFYFMLSRPHMFPGFLYTTIIPFSLINWFGQTFYCIKRTDPSFEVLKQLEDTIENGHPRHGHHFQDEMCNIN